MMAMVWICQRARSSQCHSRWSNRRWTQNNQTPTAIRQTSRHPRPAPSKTTSSQLRRRRTCWWAASTKWTLMAPATGSITTSSRLTTTWTCWTDSRTENLTCRRATSSSEMVASRPMATKKTVLRVLCKLRIFWVFSVGFRFVHDPNSFCTKEWALKLSWNFKKLCFAALTWSLSFFLWFLLPFFSQIEGRRDLISISPRPSLVKVCANFSFVFVSHHFGSS